MESGGDPLPDAVWGATFQGWVWSEVWLGGGRKLSRVSGEARMDVCADVLVPLQKWIAAVCALQIYCVQRNTHAECTCAKCAQIAHVHTKYVLLAFVLYVCIL